MAKSPYVYLCNNSFSIFYSGFRYSRHYHSVYYNESITHISSDTEPEGSEKTGPLTENNIYSLGNDVRDDKVTFPKL